MTLSVPWCATTFSVQYWVAGEEAHLRQVIIIVVCAGLIAYDLFYLNGKYVRLVIAEAWWVANAVEVFLRGLF